MSSPSEEAQGSVGVDEANTLPPSLDLAFDWVKGVLRDQLERSKALDSKANTLFTAATVVLGVGISAGTLSINTVHISAMVFGGLALIAYVFVFGFAFFVWTLRKYETLDDPVMIREHYCDMKPSQFKTELLTRLGEAHTANQHLLVEKSRSTQFLLTATFAELLFLVASLSSIAFTK